MGRTRSQRASALDHAAKLDAAINPRALFDADIVKAEKHDLDVKRHALEEKQHDADAVAQRALDDWFDSDGNW